MLDKYSESDILTLNVSNSIWINSDKTPQRFSKTYQDMLSKTFDATSDIVTDKNAVSEINGWVNDKTEGKIPTIITEDNKDFWAMLVNAVYFKGRWLNEFNKGATEKDVFTSRDSSQTEIDFMNRRAWMSYANTDGVSIVALPYLTRQDVFDETLAVRQGFAGKVGFHPFHNTAVMHPFQHQRGILGLQFSQIHT